MSVDWPALLKTLAEDSVEDRLNGVILKIREAAEGDIARLLEFLGAHFKDLSLSDDALRTIFHELRGRHEGGAALPRGWPASIAQIYGQLGPGSRARCVLLQWLAAAGRENELRTFVKLLVEDPPLDDQGVGLAVSPLLQRRDYDPAILFPALLDAISHPSVAAVVLDYANFLTRQGRLDTHPAHGRVDQLTGLLGNLVQQLESLQEQGDIADGQLGNVARRVDEAISLAVALCDALAWIGAKESIGKLYQALEVRHRRLRTEAAAALAKLGEARGREALAALAADPICRLRVLAYAEELGMENEIDARHLTLEARAEAELALWLADPSQIGIPPTRIELVDQRRQCWPGYDDPVECFLFRFSYEFAQGKYSNIGIAGPLTHAFHADLQDLPPEDIYAAFAGWHVDSDEIHEVDLTSRQAAVIDHVDRLMKRINDAGCFDVTPLILGFFFGDRYLVASAERQGNRVIVVADERDIQWHALGNPQRPIGAAEGAAIYKGRRLLRAFN